MIYYHPLNPKHQLMLIYLNRTLRATLTNTLLLLYAQA